MIDDAREGLVERVGEILRGDGCPIYHLLADVREDDRHQDDDQKIDRDERKEQDFQKTGG